MFKHIVVGVDGREGGRDAVALARLLGAMGGRLTLAYVVARGAHVYRGADGAPEASDEGRAEALLEAVRGETGVEAQLRRHESSSVIRLRGAWSGRYRAPGPRRGCPRANRRPGRRRTARGLRSACRGARAVQRIARSADRGGARLWPGRTPDPRKHLPATRACRPLPAPGADPRRPRTRERRSGATWWVELAITRSPTRLGVSRECGSLRSYRPSGEDTHALHDSGPARRRLMPFERILPQQPAV
jgi:hypothetical protein